MKPGDWFNAAVNLVLGVLLGLVIDGLAQLVTTAFWPVVVIIPLLFFAILLFDGLIDGLVEKVFPRGVRPARKTRPAKRTPLPRRLSLPVGLVLGVALARFGSGNVLISAFS